MGIVLMTMSIFFASELTIHLVEEFGIEFDSPFQVLCRTSLIAKSHAYLPTQHIGFIVLRVGLNGLRSLYTCSEHIASLYSLLGEFKM